MDERDHNPEETIRQAERRKAYLQSPEVLILQIEEMRADIRGLVTTVGTMMKSLDSLVVVFSAIAGSLKVAVRILLVCALIYAGSVVSAHPALMDIFTKWLPSVLKGVLS
jgi:hypothetical protein